jgi:hypothetical protein
MSYYSAQARNAAHLPHNVTFATFSQGKQVEGKLSDFKTAETRHLWKDDIIESPRKAKERKAVERKTEVVKHCRKIPPIYEHDEYKSAIEAVEIVGGHVSTIRAWIHNGELKDVKKVFKEGRYRFEVNIKEVTELVRRKREIQQDGTRTPEQLKKIRRREYMLAYYHRTKKLKFMRETL